MCLYLCRETGADKVFIMDCMTVLLSIFQTMKSRSHHAVLAGWMFSTAQAFAGTYPLGDMTCPEIGQFASQAMQWREDSVTPKEALQRLENLRPGESVEKKNLLMVLSLVYGGYGDGWTVKSAGDAMRIDCQTGR
jgi:hypothetical protein